MEPVLKDARGAFIISEKRSFSFLAMRIGSFSLGISAITSGFKNIPDIAYGLARNIEAFLYVPIFNFLRQHISYD